MESREILEMLYKVCGEALKRAEGNAETAESEKCEFFPLDEIKAGYMLTVREDNGKEYNMTVIPAIKFLERDKTELVVVNREEREYWPLEEFDKELITYGLRAIKVMKILGCTCPRFCLDNTEEDRELLWERK